MIDILNVCLDTPSLLGSPLLDRFTAASNAACTRRATPPPRQTQIYKLGQQQLVVGWSISFRARIHVKDRCINPIVSLAGITSQLDTQPVQRQSLPPHPSPSHRKHTQPGTSRRINTPDRSGESGCRFTCQAPPASQLTSQLRALLWWPRVACMHSARPPIHC